MSSLFVNLPTSILQASLIMGLVAVVVQLVLWLTRPRSALFHRVAWVVVLLQGLFIFHWSWEIPWYRTAQDAAGVYQPLPFPEPFGGFTEVEPGETQPQSDRASASLPQAPSPLPQAPSPSWTAKVFWSLWIGGMVCVTGFYLACYCLLLLALSGARPAPSGWSDEWNSLRGGRGVGSSIPLLVHNRMGPMLCRTPGGYRVVVPEEIWSQFSQTQRLSILQHELAHYQRSDVWKSLLARLLLLPHWFNPLAWWAVRKFDEAGEWSCDQALANEDPNQIPNYARALMAIARPDIPQVCAPAARGSSLSVRLRRLLAFHLPEDSVMKRIILTLGLGGAVLVGLVRIQLVAQEPNGEGQSQQIELAFEQRVRDFARDLEPGDSDSLKRFQGAITTPAGLIVMRDRAAWARERLQGQVRGSAFSDFVERHFEMKDGIYRIRDDRQDFASDFLRTVALFSQDIDQMKPVILATADRIAAEDDLDRLFQRFLKHEAAATMIYVEHLRHRLRPNEELVLRVLGDLFTANEQGQYVIRASSRPEAEEFVRRFRRATDALNLVEPELRAWSGDFASTSELDKSFKESLRSDRFGAIVVMDILHGSDEPIGERVEGFFNHLEELTIDTGEGVSVRPEGFAEAREILAHFGRFQTMASKLAGAVQSFAAKIKPMDNLHEQWRTMMAGKLMQMRLASELGGGGGNPEEAIRMLLGELLEETEEGKLQVRSEEPEGPAELVRSLFRAYRQVRRRGRMFDAIASNFADESVAEAIGSFPGKFVLIQMIERTMVRGLSSGVDEWIAEHFEQTDQGWVAREGAEPAIEEFLATVAEVEKELTNDDF